MIGHVFRAEAIDMPAETARIRPTDVPETPPAMRLERSFRLRASMRRSRGSGNQRRRVTAAQRPRAPLP
jgi:hypothetical protein